MPSVVPRPTSRRRRPRARWADSPPACPTPPHGGTGTRGWRSPLIRVGRGKPTASLEVKVGQGKLPDSEGRPRRSPTSPRPSSRWATRRSPTSYQVGPRQLRLIGKRLGTTDLSITTGAGKTYDFEIQVVADLELLGTQLRQMFPDATLQARAGPREAGRRGAGPRRRAGRADHLDPGVPRSDRSQQVQIVGQIDDVPGISVRAMSGADPRRSIPNAPGGE